MSELRDTPVKLFGWTITSSLSLMNNQSATDNIEQDSTSLQRSSDESKETSETSEITTTTTTSEEKTTNDMKKPDKILPCPRCNSADTKFCYYNNYNVSQPRHFCRNCQRYWTSGGTMRTVPVGSGRRKNKGWVSSSDHYMHTENTSSSAKILSFESSDEESLVTEDGKHHSTASKDLNNFQRFLPRQVTSSVSPPWPYQYPPPNPAFYHIPVYWACTVPFWPTLGTSTCLGKRTREEASHESIRENKDTFVRARLDSQSQFINDEANIATKNRVFYPVPMKREKKQQFSLVVNNRFVPETYLNLQANPAAMSRSMSFRESM